MANRITIVLDEDMVAKLRKIQAKEIQKSKSSTSFSLVVNDALRKGLKSTAK